MELHIEIRQGGVFVNDTDFIPFSSTNLTEDKLLFSFRTVHQMELKMLSFNKEEGKLDVQISNYLACNKDVFVKQKSKHVINYIAFKNIYFPHFEPLLTFYNKEKLSPLLVQKKPKTNNSSSGTLHVNTFKVNLKKVQFKNGKVVFKHNLKWYKESPFLEIHNIHILKDFEYIKFFFAKIFGRKSIDVKVQSRSTKEAITLVSVASSQIKSIDKDTIKILKGQVFKDITKKKNIQQFTPDTLLTIDDLIREYDEEGFGNIDISEKEMFFSLIEKKGVRNRKELAYLASNIQDENSPLLININPKVGFVFIHQGETMIHFIWELLNSNATYIWSTEELQVKKSIKKIEEQIALIRNVGRTQYRNEFDNSSQLYFNYVIHKTAKAGIDDPFPLWIAKIHEVLI